jgi:hypothetical protein
MRSLLIFLFSMSVSAAAGLLFAYPLAGAIVCPSCFGFAAIGENAFVQRAMPENQRREAAQTLRQASARVYSFYGELLREPRVFLCADDGCYRRYAGTGSKGTAFLDRALILAPDGITVPIAAHEMSHVELHARIGLYATVRDVLPRWFDEGLAINVSDDPQYLLPGTGRARCMIRSNEPLPVSRQEWLEDANGRLYAIAACRVAEWLAARRGASAVRLLAEKIARGETFDRAYDGALR